MNSLPWFKNFPDDYLSGSIRFCSYETQGVFAILTNILWKREGYLPANVTDISMITGIESICLAKALEQLEEKQCICFTEDKKLYVKFILEQLEKRLKIREIKTECGKQGLGKKHKHQGDTPTKAKAKHMQSICKAYGVLRAYGSNSSFISINLKEELRVKSFLEVWDSWLEYRAEKKLPNSDRALKLHLKEASKYSPEDAVRLIETAIQANWQGVFPIKPTQIQPAFISQKELDEKEEEREMAAWEEKKRVTYEHNKKMGII